MKILVIAHLLVIGKKARLTIEGVILVTFAHSGSSYLHVGRVERYALKSVVSRLLPASSTARCSLALLAPLVRVFRSVEHSSAHFVGLQHCASVWSCPVCAAKISERRRQSLQSAIERWSVVPAHAVVLLTLTVPHTFDMQLKPLLQSLLLSWRGVTQSKRFSVLRGMFGLSAYVRGLEVTWSNNAGWHPHIHVLMFFDRPFDRPYFARDEYYDLWSRHVVGNGLALPSIDRGIRFDSGRLAGSYLTTHGLGHWGLSSEITKSHIKRSRFSFSPWDFLRFIRDNPKSSDSRFAATLFSEYATSFFGARQLHYSSGAKSTLGIDVSSDREIEFARVDTSCHIADIDYLSYRRAYLTGFVPRLLQIAEQSPGDLSYFLSL